MQSTLHRRTAAGVVAVCFAAGVARGQNVTFVRADQWLGGWEERDPGEAILDVVRRFVRAYGPTRHSEDLGVT